MTMSTEWASRADVIQDSLEAYYGAPMPQYLHNRYPLEDGDDEVFNYWWLAHLVDCRVDAYLRSGDRHRLEQAIAVHDNIIERNDGSLFNDYFDDMLWFALATLRIYQANDDRKYFDEVVQWWNHIIEYGWNDIMGPSLSWRKQQLDYKNTPANAPLVILGARLYQITGEKQYLDYAQGAFDWLNENLVRPNGFVDDGMNRMGDKAIDNQWEFTYNQGIYIGAALELSTCHGDDEAYVELASKNATASLDMLVKDGVFKVDGDGGDEGLFKGIFYRYAGLLIDRLPEDSLIRKRLIDFTVTSTDRMWANGESNDSGAVLIGNDWNSKPSGRIYYSTELSAIMAAELRAQLEGK